MAEAELVAEDLAVEVDLAVVAVCPAAAGLQAAGKDVVKEK